MITQRIVSALVRPPIIESTSTRDATSHVSWSELLTCRSAATPKERKTNYKISRKIELRKSSSAGF
jgi:hypothetical protein